MTLPSDDEPEMAAPLPCMFIGCDRPSRKNSYCATHNKQRDRRGVEGMTPIGHDEKAVVTPCRKCGGRDFSITTRKTAKRGIGRYCLACNRRNRSRWRHANPFREKMNANRYRMSHIEEVRERAREWARGARLRRKQLREAQQGATSPPCASPAAPTNSEPGTAAPPSCAPGGLSGTTTSSRCSTSGRSSTGSGELAVSA